MHSTDPDRKRLGTLLVTLQLGLIGALAALAAPAFVAGQARAGAWVLAALGAALGLWSLAANRPGNFNIRPNPRANGRLVSQGPYRWIRHPMYSTMMICAAAACWAAGPAWGWTMPAVLVGLLAAVLGVKANLEERLMADLHPGYSDYRAHTRRFLPFVY